MLHILALCYICGPMLDIYGLYVTYTGSMLHIRAYVKYIRALCSVYVFYVTDIYGPMLHIRAYVKYTGSTLHIQALY